MDFIEVKPMKELWNLNEISQRVNIKFAMLSKDNEQCHPFVKCRDYLHDVLYTMHSGKSEMVYGFQYKPNVNPIVDLSQIRLLVTSPEVESICDYALKLIHHYETVGNITPKTELYKVKNKGVEQKYERVFVGARDWLCAPAMISLYSLLIRMGAKKFEFKSSEELLIKYATLVGSSLNDQDKSYLRYIYKFIEPIVFYRKELFKLKNDEDIYKEFLTVQNNTRAYDYHNYRGILSLCSGSYSGISSQKLLELSERFKEERKKMLKTKETTKTKTRLQVVNKKPLSAVVGSEVLFGLVSAPPERKLCTGLFSCRDYFNDYMYYLHNCPANMLYHLFSDIEAKPDFEKLRLLVLCRSGSNDKSNKSKIYSAKKMLNVMEKEIGMSSLSKITEVDLVQGSNKNLIAYLITGPKEWMSYSYTLSIVTLLIKICFKGKERSIKVSSVETMKEYLDSINVDKHDVYTGAYTECIKNNIDFLLKYFYDLFTPEKEEKKFYADGMYTLKSNVHSDWGIMSLLQTPFVIKKYNETLYNRVKKAKKDYEKEEEQGKK